MLVCAGIFVIGLSGCTKVPPGNVGIRVNMYGSNKGVDNAMLETGRVWYNPITEDIFKFPTYMQNAVWTKEDTDESPGDQSVTFNSVEGSSINADVAISYQIIPESVPSIFIQLRQDADYITSVYVRSKTQDALSRTASKMKVIDIFGSKKEELLQNVKDDLQTTMPGFKFDMITFIGALRVDPLVEQSISATIQATQKAIEAENKVKQSVAEAQQKVEEARGLAESILLEAKARSEANELLTKSLSPQLIQYEALQKWDGILPKVTGEVVPFITVDKEK